MTVSGCGCLLEPTSVAVRIADKTHHQVGDRVAICGVGRSVSWPCRS
jgi:hypothetical protein